MYYVFKPIIITAVLFVITLIFFLDNYVTVQSAFYTLILYSSILSAIFMMVTGLIYRFLMKASYEKYQRWLTEVEGKKDNILIKSMLRAASFVGYVFFGIYALMYVNQTYATLPLEESQGYVISSSRWLEHNKGFHVYRYAVYISTKEGTVKLHAQENYDEFLAGEKLKVKLQKGRLGLYFVRDIQKV